STRFSEEYRRFYFRDIQAICLQKDPPRSWLNHGMIAFAGALFVAGLFWSSHQVWGTLLVIALLIYLAILARRPQCAVWIQTAVGTDRLPSLRRTRPVRKAMAVINEKIYASQPAATAETLAAMLATPPPLPLGGEAAPRVPPPLPQSAPAASSRLFVASFAATLALGALKLAEALLTVPALTWSLPFVYMATIALFIWALIRAGIRKLRPMAVAATFIALGLTGSLGAASIRWVLARGLMTLSDPNVDRIYTGISRNTPVQVTLSLLLLGVGIWGLFALLSE